MTNRKVSVSTPLGQKIIDNYRNIMIGGAFFGQAEKPKINPKILKKTRKTTFTTKNTWGLFIKLENT